MMWGGIHTGGHRKTRSSVVTEVETIQRNGMTIQIPPAIRNAWAITRRMIPNQSVRRAGTTASRWRDAIALDAIVDPFLGRPKLDDSEQEQESKEHPTDRRRVPHVQVLEGSVVEVVDDDVRGI